MDTIISFFKTLWTTILTAVGYITAAVTVAFSSVATAISTFVVLYEMFSTDSLPVSTLETGVKSAFGFLTTNLDSLPDVVQLGIYSLSLDSLLTYIVAILSLLYLLAIPLLVFWVITVPTFYISVYLSKLSANVLLAFIPPNLLPLFLHSYSKSPPFSITVYVKNGLSPVLKLFGSYHED